MRFAVAVRAVVLDLGHQIPGERPDTNLRAGLRQTHEVEMRDRLAADDVGAIPTCVRAIGIGYDPHVSRLVLCRGAWSDHVLERTDERALEPTSEGDSVVHRSRLDHGCDRVCVVEAV